MEAMLGGFDEVKEAFDQAITVLPDLVEECDPALVPPGFPIVIAKFWGLRNGDS